MLAKLVKFAELCWIFDFGRFQGRFLRQNRRTPGVYRGDGWNFGAPRAKLSSNPALNSAGFRPGEPQRLEMLLALVGKSLFTGCPTGAKHPVLKPPPL